MTIIEGYETFLKSRKCGEVTVSNYMRWISLFLDYLRSQDYDPYTMPLEELTLQHLNHFTSWVSCSYLKYRRRSSVRMYQQAVKAMLKYLQQCGHLQELDLDRWPPIRTGLGDLKKLSQDDITLIDDCIIQAGVSDVLVYRDLCLVHLMYDAGLTVRQICSLRRSDVDLEHGLINLLDVPFQYIQVRKPLIWYLTVYDMLAAPDRKTFLVNRSGKSCNPEMVKKVIQDLQRMTGINSLTPTLLHGSWQSRKVG